MQEEHYIKIIINYLNRTWRLFALFLVITLFIAGFNVTSNPIYMASGSIVFNQSSTSPLQALSANFTGLNMTDNTQILNRYIRFLKSPKTFTRLAYNLYSGENVSLIQKYIKLGNSSLINLNIIKPYLPSFIPDTEIMTVSETDREIKKFSRQLMSVVKVYRGDNVSIRISVRSGDSKISVKVVNAMIALAVEKISEQDVGELKNAKNFLNNQLSEIGVRIKKYERDIIIQKNKSNLSEVEDSGGDFGSKSIDLQRELVEYKIKIKYNKVLLKKYRNEMKKENETRDLASSNYNNSKFSYKNKIFRVERQNELYLARIQTLKPLVKKIKDRQRREPRSEQIISSLNKKLETEYTYYSDLKKQILKINMQKLSSKNRVSNIEKANILDTIAFISPSIQAGTAVLIALFFGGLLTFLMEKLFPHVLSKKDLKGLSLHYMGSISVFKLTPKLLKLRTLFSRSKVKKETIRIDLNSNEASCFKFLRSRILNFKSNSNISIGEKASVIALVSPQAQEGKTFLSFNISHSLSRAKKKTLIIDFDFAKAHLTSAFEDRNKQGLSDYLFDKVACLDDIVQKKNDYLDFIPVGQSIHDILNYLPEDELQLLIVQLKSKYDIILLDTPALMPVIDAIDVVKSANMILLCLSIGSSRLDFVQYTVERLRQVNSSTSIGYIFNRNNIYGFQDNYSYYGKYQGDQKSG